MNPEATITELPGGYLIHTATEEDGEEVQNPHIFVDWEDAIEHISNYFSDWGSDDEEDLERFVL